MPPRSLLGALSVSFSLSVFPLASAGGQQDSTRTDSTRAARLPEIAVTVTRQTAPLSRIPAAISVLNREALTRGRATLGLDEALADVPGVHVANRYNPSLDQRLSIRGFGSRSSFGMRGLRLVLDGVPQTLPDGQGQLSNLDLASVDRIEILRGASSALYGNAAGGVLQFSTVLPVEPGFTQSFRAQGGTFDTRKWQFLSGFRSDATVASLAVSRMQTDGFRDHSSADQRQVTARVLHDITSRWQVGLRVAVADAPEARNPGALTAAEAAATPSAAAPNNVARGADKDVTQTQVSLHLNGRPGSRVGGGPGLTTSLSAWVQWRDLDNPLATAPPAPASPTEGTFNTIDRVVVGTRAEAAIPFDGTRGTLTVGADGQRMRDERRNFRSDGGRITTALLVDQRETVSELGPFAHASWRTGPVVLSGGVRYDRLVFTVRDRVSAGGEDHSGRRVMANVSGSVGATLTLDDQHNTYVTVGTAFESPTSTELVSLPGGVIGLNRDLGPQRAVSVEWGLRGRQRHAEYSLALYRISVRDALIQAREQDGRAFFQNAGRTRHQGIEAGLQVRPLPGFSLQGAYTLSDLRFTRFRVTNGSVTDTLDGNRLPGVPLHQLRLGLRSDVGPVTLDLDQTLASGVWADDRNTQQADSWGAGVTGLRATWTLGTGRLAGQPFVGVENLFNRRYISAVTVNGFGGRVFEPGASRQVYVGATFDLGSWSTGR